MLGHQRAGGGGADDPRTHHRHLHQRVRRHQPVGRNMAADRDRLRRPEEAGDAAQQAQHRVDLPHRRRHEQQQHETRAHEVARDERGLERPAIDEDAGQRAEQGQRQHVGDLDAGDLLGRAQHAIRDDTDDGKERKKVAEQADDLREPHPAHDGEVEHFAERHRRGRRLSLGSHRRLEGHDIAPRRSWTGMGTETENQRRRSRRGRRERDKPYTRRLGAPETHGEERARPALR